MTYIAAALFFTFSLLAAAVMVHMMVRNHWDEILLALKGELGLDVRPRARPSRWAAQPQPRRRAAF